MKRIPVCLRVCLVCSLFLAAAQAQAPGGAEPQSPTAPSAAAPAATTPEARVLRLVKFSGELRDAMGRPRTGVVGVTFALYEQQEGGAPRWLETQNVELDAQGRYSVLLGATRSEGLPLGLFTAGQARWLGIQVEGDPEQPRVLLVSVPYALKAADADTLGGRPASAFVLAEPAASDRAEAAAPAAAGTNVAIESGQRIVSQIAAVSGTGTINKLTKWLDTLGALGDSVVFESGGLVGIGTTAPGYPLTVLGAGAHKIAAIGPAGGNVLSTFVEGTNQRASLYVKPGGLATLEGWEDGVGPLNFGLNPVGGNVGIGTTTPGYPLTVTGTSSAHQIVAIGPAGGNVLSTFVQGTNQRASLYVKPGGLATLEGWEDGVGPLNFGLNPVGGNVGIGTTSPTERLEVAGNLKVSGGGVITGDGSGLTNVSATALTGGIVVQANATSPNLIGGFSGNSVTAGAVGATISGGGQGGYTNSVTYNFGTVGGGYGNTASNFNATVGGGYSNTASGNSATVAGGWSNTASGVVATVGGGQSNLASGSRAAINGGQSNTASGFNATVGGGSSNTASGSIATVGGGFANSASGSGATIGGGGDPGGLGFGNRVTDDYGTVGGGGNNQAGDNAGTTTDRTFATVAGGSNNTASGGDSTVGGGRSNTASGSGVTVGGGVGNTASGNNLTIAGGIGNAASFLNATVGGGGTNTASYHGATVGGGNSNTASGFGATVGGGSYSTASGNSATVGGGSYNTVSGGWATVGGGYSNTASGIDATVGGGFGNSATAAKGTIAGGGRTDEANAATGNRVTDDFGTVGGGGNNQAGDNAGTTGDRTGATVGGGLSNTASGARSTVAGGENNRATLGFATVSGGHDNLANGGESTIGGGTLNTAGGTLSAIGGGSANNASATQSTVGGGASNTTSGDQSTVAGGIQNTASGFESMVPGGALNTASGRSSFAAGRKAKALHDGAFVWGDFTEAEVASSGTNQFIVRASGGVTFYTASNLSTGASLAAGSGSWSALSDRNVKQNFAPVNGREVLERLVVIPIQTWTYRAQDPSVRHMGPMAQDFRAAFGLGEDERHISTVDADGVALAAIQALYRLSLQKDEEIRQLRRELEELRGLVRQVAAAHRLVERAAR